MEPATPNRRGGLARILVIDDDPAFVGTLTQFLVEDGYEALAALNGGDGLMLFELEHPDLILLDLRMPGIGGHDVLRRVLMVRPDMPVIIVSGLGDAEGARQMLRRGAIDYLPKPVDLEVLGRSIAAALGRPHPRQTRRRSSSAEAG
jgi:DNA-binding response OmpR family regulator